MPNGARPSSSSSRACRESRPAAFPTSTTPLGIRGHSSGAWRSGSRLGTFLDLAPLCSYLVAYAAAPARVRVGAAGAGPPGHRRSGRGSHYAIGGPVRSPSGDGSLRDHPGPECRLHSTRAAVVSTRPAGAHGVDRLVSPPASAGPDAPPAPFRLRLP